MPRALPAGFRGRCLRRSSVVGSVGMIGGNLSMEERKEGRLAGKKAGCYVCEGEKNGLFVFEVKGRKKTRREEEIVKGRETERREERKYTERRRKEGKEKPPRP